MPPGRFRPDAACEIKGLLPLARFSDQRINEWSNMLLTLLFSIVQFDCTHPKSNSKLDLSISRFESIQIFDIMLQLGERWTEHRDRDTIHADRASR